MGKNILCYILYILTNSSITKYLLNVEVDIFLVSILLTTLHLSRVIFYSPLLPVFLLVQA